METTEQFIHYLWRYRLLRPPLTCVSGEPLEVLHPGIYNRDGGPDFFNARVRIGQTIWAGNVEIHLRASDWFRHCHQDDPAYRNVILHVVEWCDTEVTGAGGHAIPVAEVRGCYPPVLAARFEALRSARCWIPCQPVLSGVDPVVFRTWAPALAVERLMERTDMNRSWIGLTENRWDEVIFQLFAGAMGCKVNTHPFELLARSTPLRILNKHRDQLHVLEALLFGQAALLEAHLTESYPAALRQCYLFFREKYGLRPLEPGTLKFLRLRPLNFPTLRISQLASLIHGQRRFPEHLLEPLSVGELIASLQTAASGFWDTHYTFERISACRIKKLGADTIRLILINGLSPLLFLYGTERNQPACRERALAILEELPGESSTLISTWERLGFRADNALYTQALRHLKGTYCDRKRCLECRIGKKLLTGSPVHSIANNGSI